MADKQSTPHFILASASPRRSSLLTDAGAVFTVVRSAAAETEIPGDPCGTALANARRKAEDVFAKTGGIVLGADTVVALDGIIFGKPTDKRAARRTLRALSGRTHTVMTGVCAVSEGGVLSGYVQSGVTFKRLNRAFIRRYVISGVPMDKAGAYGIQEAGESPVARFSGALDNIVGLPVQLALALVVQAKEACR